MRKSVKQFEALLAKDNKDFGAKFSYGNTYGHHELWSDGKRVEVGTLKQVTEAWLRLRLNVKEERLRLPWRLSVLPSGYRSWIFSPNIGLYASVQELRRRKGSDIMSRGLSREEDSKDLALEFVYTTHNMVEVYRYPEEAMRSAELRLKAMAVELLKFFQD